MLIQYDSCQVSLARIIVYSMQPDGVPVPASGISTPWAASGFMTPEPGNDLGDYLSAPLGNKPRAKMRTYIAGSKALDSLARLIMSTESFFHPNNSGSWTADVSYNIVTTFLKITDRIVLTNCIHQVYRL